MSDATSHYPQQDPQPPAPEKRRWFARHKILTGIGVLVLVGVIVGSVNGGSPEAASTSADTDHALTNNAVSETTASDDSSANAAAANETAHAEAVAEPTASDDPSADDSAADDESASGMTVGQKNAVDTAENYLSTAAFSRSGLIQQLKYEGYSRADASFAADAVHADWNEQAGKAAEEYLSM
ncbi:MAG TPA: Ltp family lipoprotein, partial [Nocardioidaceae bacterium]|nr:Ltp family lipoprotein [Nocardioidaceae bacterium]